MSCFRIFDKCYHDKMLSIMYEIDLTIIHCNIKIFRKIVKSACIFYQIYQENQYFSYIFTNCISRVKNRPNWDNNTLGVEGVSKWQAFQHLIFRNIFILDSFLKPVFQLCLCGSESSCKAYKSKMHVLYQKCKQLLSKVYVCNAMLFAVVLHFLTVCLVWCHIGMKVFSYLNFETYYIFRMKYQLTKGFW